MLCARFSRFCAVLAVSATIFAAFLSVDVSAVSESGHYMTPEEFRSLIGDDITFTYFNGTDYVTGHFYYYALWDGGGLSMKDSDYTSLSSHPFVQYRCTSHQAFNANPGFITVQISPRFSISDTYDIRSFIALQSGSVTSDVFNDSQWQWVMGGSQVSFLAPSYQGDDNNCTFPVGGGSSTSGVCIPVSVSSDDLISGYSLDVKFYGVSSTANQRLSLCIGLPYISDDATAAEGTLPPVTTAPSGSGDINVNVDVDLNETNGILGDIKEGIAGLAETLLDGIKGLFVPDEDFMTDFKTDMEELLEEHLGGLYEAEQIVEGFVEELPDVVEKESIYIPACNIPLAGETFTLGDWTVPLKVTGMPAILYNSIAFIIDFLCTTAFINMCRRKLEIFLNPDSEVIEE